MYISVSALIGYIITNVHICKCTYRLYLLIRSKTFHIRTILSYCGNCKAVQYRNYKTL
jgi:hypothetical protein